MKLVMTLLVRDEEEILERNICHHLNQGVDFIIATDNNSKDGTRDILEKYKRKGVLEYVGESELNYQQSAWVTRMCQIAIKKYQADYVLNCDADEFWVAKSGEIKNEINRKYDVIKVGVENYLPPANTAIKKFDLNNFEYLVKKTKPVPFEYKDKKTKDYFLYEYPRKIIVSKNVHQIGDGNDSVKNQDNLKYINCDSIYIFHFPIRSYAHFEKKIKNAASIFKNPVTKDPNYWWHWRGWYEAYKHHRLKEEYEEMCLKGRIDGLVHERVVVKFRVLKKIKYAIWIYRIKYLLNFFKNH